MNVLPAIQVNSLAIRRGGREILHLGPLTIPNGQVVVILGPNGAGKSTLLKCLLGFTRPNSGKIDVLGQSVAPRAGTSFSRLRRQIGYVPQVLAAHSETPLTVREVVAIGRTGIVGLFRRLGRNDWEIVDTWLERLGLAGLAHRAYASLSGGEQRKTLIAKAMVQQPEILMLDEPTANLDLFWREQIVKTLDELYAATQRTILLVCHELENIPSCCRRLLVLRAGGVIADGPPDAILTRRLVQDLYGPGLQLLHQGGRYIVAPGKDADDD
jgi:ABC-type cobalamin/Fe3+-siderophores transport system ATPase subunit